MPGRRSPFHVQKKSLVATFQLFFGVISIARECRLTVFAFDDNLHTSQHCLHQYLMKVDENDQ
jgi:hypothetical protein